MIKVEPSDRKIIKKFSRHKKEATLMTNVLEAAMNL
jgi:hypothetical protein